MIFPDINECESSPCKSGSKCIDKPNGYVCNCSKGFGGIDCSKGLNNSYIN